MPGSATPVRAFLCFAHHLSTAHCFEMMSLRAMCNRVARRMFTVALTVHNRSQEITPAVVAAICPVVNHRTVTCVVCTSRVGEGGGFVVKILLHEITLPKVIVVHNSSA